MNSKLAKKLKDAGFPERKCGCSTSGLSSHFCGKVENELSIPTLSELIEACGRVCLWEYQGWNVALMPMVDLGEFGEDYVDKSWYENIEYGKTPEEAVARLWLALNEKK